MVLKARRKDKFYAIKALIGKDRDQKTNTLQQALEVEILRRVEHQRVPRLIESFSIKKVHYIVQEYIEGLPLSSLLDRGVRFSEKEVKEIIFQLLVILNDLHYPEQKNNGIVHRDLRLSNILFNQGRVYLIDFGLARFINSEQFPFCPDQIGKEYPNKINTLRSQTIPGVETYRILRKEISPRSDLFGLGVVAIDLFSSWIEDESLFDQPWEKVLPLSEPFIDFLRKLLSRKNSFETASEALAVFQRTIRDWR